MKYSDYFMEILKSEDFTHCFYVAGGNSMHLLESASRYFTCIPVIHEVTAAIASEYFNESGPRKAFALATAGPGLTNMLTGVAGAWLESHELFVIGGQVKSVNLKKSGVRQGGIQEIDGIELTKSITKASLRIENPVPAEEFIKIIHEGKNARKGPVFIEICLDASAAEVSFEAISRKPLELRQDNQTNNSLSQKLEHVSTLISKSQRPLILFGNGVPRDTAKKLLSQLVKFQIPVATTWGGADRCSFDYDFFAGRPNTFGMRWSNIFQQQADLLIVLGSSLALQQTGFNVDEYLPVGEIIHVDVDKDELEKENPKNRYRLNMSCEDFSELLPGLLEKNLKPIGEWVNFLQEIRSLVPTLEISQKSVAPYISPHEVINALSKLTHSNDSVVICSSGGTFTAGMQCFENKENQILLANKGLASMGYGLAGAIGVAFQNRKSKTLLFEGDGGFAQNLQDLGTVNANALNIKIFITNNRGYASIRTSQKNYFGGNYLGCDIQTGLSFPNWKKISESFGVRHFLLSRETFLNSEFMNLFEDSDSVLFEIIADPEQVYLPKVSSVIKEDGSMESTPIHVMVPKLEPEIEAKVFRFIPPPQ